MDSIFSTNNRSNHSNRQAEMAGNFAVEGKPTVIFLLVTLSVALVIGGLLAFRESNSWKMTAPLQFIGQEKSLVETAAVDQSVASDFVQPEALEDPSPRTIAIRQDDTLGKIFRRLGLEEREARRILALAKVTQLKKLMVGKKMTIWIDPINNTFAKLNYGIDRLTTLVVSVNKKGIIHVDLRQVKPKAVIKYASARIDGSIYAAAKKLSLPSGMVKQFVNLFSGRVNSKKLNGQDRFSIFYREYLVDGKSVKGSEIVAAELMHGGVSHRLIAFKEKENSVAEFYTPEGRSIKPSFTRYPLTYSRIGSKFSPLRKHPILGISRPHRGVDFVAKAGTPIKATSNGRVAFVGYKNGYGRTIEIKNGKYSTLYAHLSKFAVRAGEYTKQGNVIGYVGSSGLSTNPHLHYEFRINGVHHDPLKVVLPGGELIAAKYRGKFFAMSRNIIAQLDAHQRAHKSFAMHSYSSFE